VTRRDVVLTGLPRSGTTLACLLLNKLPDTVALSEPFNPRMFAEVSSEEEACDVIEHFYLRMRRKIRRQGVAISRHVGGEVTDNLFGDTRSDTGERRRRAGKGKITIDKELSHDFSLVIKTPGRFTAHLPALTRRFPAFAIIRNPLSVLASWNTLEIPGERGRFPLAERYDENLARQLSTQSDSLERQLRLLSWWYERFYITLDRDNIIPYEDMVLSGGRALAKIDTAASTLREQLSSKNLNTLYNRDEMRSLGETLLRSEGSYWRFYPRESVRELLTRVT
jgi:hypothetical protein